MLEKVGEGWRRLEKEGLPNGKGIETWSDGRKYIGKYKDGLFNGQGTMTWADGKRYVGEYKRGKTVRQQQKGAYP